MSPAQKPTVLFDGRFALGRDAMSVRITRRIVSHIFTSEEGVRLRVRGFPYPHSFLNIQWVSNANAIPPPGTILYVLR